MVVVLSEDSSHVARFAWGTAAAVAARPERAYFRDKKTIVTERFYLYMKGVESLNGSKKQ